MGFHFHGQAPRTNGSISIKIETCRIGQYATTHPRLIGPYPKWIPHVTKLATTNKLCQMRNEIAVSFGFRASTQDTATGPQPYTE
jgi:hypothetical protein